MKRNISAIVVLLGLVVLATRYSIASDLEVKFGLLKKDAQGRYYVYKETATVSLIMKDKDPDYRFGYTIKSAPGREFITHAVMHFPTSAAQHSGEFKTAKRESHGKTVELPSKKSVGTFAYSFRFEKGDPAGRYKLEIWIANKLEKTIEFEVVEDK